MSWKFWGFKRSTSSEAVASHNGTYSNNMYNNNRDPWGNDGPPDLDEALRELKTKFNNFFGGSSKKNNSNSGNSSQGGNFKGLLYLSLLVTFAGWFAMGINILDEKEKAVVLRLGKFHKTIGPGFNWNPWILDIVYREQVTEIQEYISSGLMLTEDENIVKVPLTTQFNIKSIKDYILNVSNPKGSLRHATESAIRHAVGSTQLNDVLSEGRVLLADEVKLRLQERLDIYGTGIHVLTVTIQEAEPPSQVKNAFDDVIAAKEDKERFVNEAESYRNSILPGARGKAQRIIEEANAYRGEVVAKAEGESQRFTKLLQEYNKAPQVTRERLYIDAMQEVLSKSNKVIVDVEGGNNLMYLPLDKLAAASNSSQVLPTSSAQPSNTINTQQIVNEVIEQLRREASRNRQSGGLR